jgi:hypothetical protein
MFDEMYFLFDINKSIANAPGGDKKTPAGSDPAQTTRITPVLKDDGNFYNQTYVVTKSQSLNYIQSNVNTPYQASKKNPYLQLLDHFDGIDSPKSLKLKSSDFAYLRDIGVYPINRLMILRRFPIGTTVPRDLNDLPYIEPVSTIVGWVKSDADFLSFSFNEEWRTQGSSEMLHVLLNDMISKEFGINMNQIVPIPGWSVGLVFGFLNKMKITDYNKNSIPMGDPNVLKESITRPHEDFGLKSDFTFSLDTVYEQKYIGDIDLTVSFMDILQNCMIMGTSDVRYIGKPGASIFEQLKIANNDPTNSSGWVTLIKIVVDAFIGAIKDSISTAVKALSSVVNPPVNSNVKQEVMKLVQNTFDVLIKSILASTVAKYHWPLRGSIAMLTGEAVTPWHLTIGNPYAPFLSMSNVYVTNVAIASKGDMMYNDIPKFLEVKVSMKQGRNMGGNEIYDMFGIEYQRIYKEVKNN